MFNALFIFNVLGRFKFHRLKSRLFLEVVFRTNVIHANGWCQEKLDFSVTLFMNGS